jgi:hypothetical protein
MPVAVDCVARHGRVQQGQKYELDKDVLTCWLVGGAMLARL